MVGAGGCLFCSIARGEQPAARVHEDGETVAFLDHRPLFPGHVLVVPREHFPTLLELPTEQMAPFFGTVRRVARVLELVLGCEGSFVALNNKVSQSVPHLHAHVVPRTRGDGLKGFFWPRQSYRDADHQEEVRARIAAALQDRSR
ncbi:MAG: HIT family protein [Deltaproteobacteria bacterium]|nr:HIT family protein [Deltaproteobacteria bacterium]